MDEARKKGISVDLFALSDCSGVPVVGVCAHKKRTFTPLLDAVEQMLTQETMPAPKPVRCRPICKPRSIHLFPLLPTHRIRFCLHSGHSPTNRFLQRTRPILHQESKKKPCTCGKHSKKQASPTLRRAVTRCFVLHAEELFLSAVKVKESGQPRRDRLLDRIFLNRKTGVPVMLVLLG